jgi:hypothetical protein
MMEIRNFASRMDKKKPEFFKRLRGNRMVDRSALNFQ